MKILILNIVFLLFSISTLFAQDVVEIGMTKDKILKMNNDICFTDTLDDGTKFIKAMVSDKLNYIYYFFNDDDICVSVILYVENYSSIQRFKDTLNTYYVYKKENLWVSYDEKYFIYYEEDMIGIIKPVFYIWSDKFKYPKSWDFLKDMKL